jgi:hypothetical protein
MEKVVAMYKTLVESSRKDLKALTQVNGYHKLVSYQNGSQLRNS